jgi:hypothetical protein
MAQVARTVTEARDRVLKEIGAEDSAEYQALVLDLLNSSISEISGLHDWEFLRKRDTLTTTDGTGLVSMPDDLDRVLAIHEPSKDEILTKVDPVVFEQVIEDAGITVPTYWCVNGYEQDTTTVAPYMQIRIHSAPASGTAYNLWYVKHLDELDSGDLLVVPPIPPRLWELVVRYAILEGLKVIGGSGKRIETAERSFLFAVDRAKKAEKFGSSHQKTMMQRGKVSNWNRNKLR